MYEEEPKYAYFNDKIVPYGEAKVHVLTPAMRYGSIVFEGIRGYWNDKEKELYVFQLKEHMQRLVQSAKMMEFDLTYSIEDLCKLTLDTIRKNNLKKDIQIRPMIYLGGRGALGSTGPTCLVITTMPFGKYLDIENGINCCVSSWTRISDNSMPPRIKCTANYQNSYLVMLQAKKDNYDFAIILNSNGKVSEGPGACLFLFRKGRPITTPVTSGILESITRGTLIQLMKDYLNLEVEVREVDRTELYIADEALLCGTAVEITPIVSIDKYKLNDGKVGALTKKLQKVFFKIIRGEIKDHQEWRIPVYKTS